MDSFKFQDIKAEKANAISKFRRFQRITTLFRFLELFVFLIVVSRFSTQFAFSFNLSAEYFRGISLTLISPQFVFILGNVIVLVLFLISGQFSSKNGGNSTDFYDEYVEKCRLNLQTCNKEEKKASESCKYTVCSDEKVIKLSRSHSENIVRARVRPAVNGDERRRELRRSMTERCRKSTKVVVVEAAAGSCTSTFAEDEMSSEEFRRTVEAFIARQQRILREEEEFSAAVVSL